MGLFSKLFGGDKADKSRSLDSSEGERALRESYPANTCSENFKNWVDSLLASASLGYEGAVQELDELCQTPEACHRYSLEQCTPEWSEDLYEYYAEECKEKGFPFYPDGKQERGMHFGSLPDDMLFVSTPDGAFLSNYPEAIKRALGSYTWKSVNPESYNPLKAWCIIRRLREAARRRDPIAMYVLSTYYFIDEFESVASRYFDTREAYKSDIEKLVARGDNWARYALGLMAPSYSREKFDLLLEAARKGNANAAYDLKHEVGMFLFVRNGNATPDVDTSWITKIGADGNTGDLLPYMQYSYSDLLTEGEAVPIDYEEALEYAVKAASAFNARGLVKSQQEYLVKHADSIRRENGRCKGAERLDADALRNLYDAAARDEEKLNNSGKPSIEAVGENA